MLIGLDAGSYVLFSIGNLKPLFESVFPQCWDHKEVCNGNWLDAIEYLEVVGIIVGQIFVGILGDWYEPYSLQEDEYMLISMQDWSTMGSYPGCSDHGSWSGYDHGCLGFDVEWMGDLLCLVSVHLRYWCR